MKNVVKVLGFALALAVIALAIASCGGGDGNSGGGSTTTRLSGTYVKEESSFGTASATFSGSNFTIKLFGADFIRGTYTITGGTTVTFSPTWVDPEWEDEDDDRPLGPWTIVDETTLQDDEGDYWFK